jgi:kynureninase
MILIEPDDVSQPILPTEKIVDIIDRHASGTALILLPGVQFYTGQYLDIAKITAHAHSKGILVGWDCAHAVGNVELKLHEWDVDFAAWCNYKYMNSGPGAIGGLFVHERHGIVDMDNASRPYRDRLTGWWGGDKTTRFKMDNSKCTNLLLRQHKRNLMPRNRVRPTAWSSRISSFKSIRA